MIEIIIILSVLAITFIVLIVSAILYFKALIKREKELNKVMSKDQRKMLKLLTKKSELTYHNYWLSNFLERSLKYAPFITFVATVIIFVNIFIGPIFPGTQETEQPVQPPIIQNDTAVIDNPFTFMAQTFPLWFWIILAGIPAYIIWRSFTRSFEYF